MTQRGQWVILMKKKHEYETNTETTCIMHSPWSASSSELRNHSNNNENLYNWRLSIQKDDSGELHAKHIKTVVLPFGSLLPSPWHWQISVYKICTRLILVFNSKALLKCITLKWTWCISVPQCPIIIGGIAVRQRPPAAAGFVILHPHANSLNIALQSR